MIEFAIKIVGHFWKRKEWRPHLMNAILTLAIAALAFFYINFRHYEAMGAIAEQKGVSGQILEEIRHVSARIDDLYRLASGK